MTQQTINIGNQPGDGTGDPARTAFNKVNQNFTEVYANATPGGSVGQIQYKLAGTSFGGFTASGDATINTTTGVVTVSAPASRITNTPSGTIAATDVQSAINEIVTDLSASSGSSLVGFLQSGTGATSRTTQAKLRDVVSVKDFGATGDGTTDDTAAIQAAIAALGRLITGNPNAATYSITQVGGGRLFFPKGKYKVTSTLQYSGGMIWFGEEQGSAIVFSPASSSACVAENTANKSWSLTQEKFTVKDMAFLAGNANAAYGLKLENTQGINLENLVIAGFYTANLYIGGTGGGGYYNTCTNVQLWDSPINLYIDGTSLNSGGVTTIVGGLLCHSVAYSPAPSYNAVINATGTTFVGTSIEGRATVAQVQDLSRGTRFVNVYYEKTSTPLVLRDFTTGLAGNLQLEAAQSGVLQLSNFPATSNDADAFEQYVPISYFKGFPKHVSIFENGNFRYGLKGWGRNNAGGTYGNGLIYFDQDTFGNSYGSLRYEAAGTGNGYVRAYQIVPPRAYKKYTGGTQRVYFHAICKLENASDSVFQLNAVGGGLGNKFSQRTDLLWGASSEYRLYTIAYTLLNSSTDLYLQVDFITLTAGRKGWFYGGWTTIGGLDYLALPAEDLFTVTAIPSATDYATWNVGDIVQNGSYAFGAAAGWICRTAGTNGTALSAVTANTTSGLTAVTFSSVLNLGVGMYITIAGVAGIKKITALTGTSGTIDSAASATVTGGAVAYSNAVFVPTFTPV
jgi:hypothetical protein